MAHKKKDLPLKLLKTLEPFLSDNSALYEVSTPDDSLLRIRDRDPHSSFCFDIKSHEFSGGTLILSVEYKPRDENSPEARKRVISAEQLGPAFGAWVELIKEYNKLKIFDDPILEQYYTEFEQENELTDEDAAYSSFDLNTQIRLDQYLNYYQKRLATFKTNGNQKEVEDIEKDIEELKTNQTRWTKEQVVGTLNKIWAKTRKFTFSLLKDVYDAGKKELIKRLVTGRIDDLLQ